MKHNNIFGDFIKRAAVMLSALFVIAATAWAETITLTSETGEVTLQNGDVLTGTGGADTHITIADGATVTLSNVEIITPDEIKHMWAGITGAGNATIILIGTNTVQGGHQCSGVWVPLGCTLTIQGNGSLTATGGESGAGIGSGYGKYCGNIVIEGGTITAIGGRLAAGIGSSDYSSCGNITITGGTITATGGYYAAGIGTGAGKSSCDNITIASGVTNLTATAGSKVTDAIGIGRNYSSDCSVGTITVAGTVTGTIPQTPFNYNPSDTTPYTVTFNANGGTGEMDEQVFISNKPQALPACAFNCDQYHVFSRWNTAADGSGYSFADEQTIINLGDITLYAQWQAIAYGITYINAVDGENCVTNTNPTSYTYYSGSITLTDPVRPGHTFDGWTWEGQDTPTKDVTIPSGSSGGRTFTAHWSFNPIATITTSTREALLLDGHTLTGTGGSNTHVTIAAGATVTLSDVNITSINAKPSCIWAGITCEGDATIILKDGTTNAVKGGYRSSGIFVAESHTLTILGNGSLTATGHDYAAGIGCGREGSCGNITIEGGNITATGGKYAAGIGCGYGTSSAHSICGDITITRTVMSITATKGTNAQHSIGEGERYCTCGTVTICDVVTGPISKSPYIHTLNSTIHFEANNGSSETMDDWLFTYDGTAQAIPTCTFTAPEGKMFVGWSTEPDGSGTYYTKQVTDILSGTLYAIWKEQTENVPNGELTLYDDQILTGTGGTDTHLTIADGATVTLSGVDITTINNSSSHQWAGISCAGDATIILSGANALKGGRYSAGIFVPKGKTLTICGDGTLTATGDTYAAGIGGNSEIPCGNIVIEGGTITATGGQSAAGIGSGKEGTCGNIVITGGTIAATGGKYATGIGCGREGSCGNITIAGGTIDATGGENASGIGCGYGISSNNSTCGNITITNGVTCIIATKESSPSSINIIGTSGSYSTCGTITVGDGLTDKTVDKTRYITVPDWTSTTSVTLAKEGYGTYYGLFDLVLPAGMKAYIVTASADDGKLTYETIANGNTTNNIVPALTAVMLQTAAADGVQTFDVGITVPTVAAINQTNLLHGSERETKTTGAGTGGKYYKLSYNTSGEDIGWYWGKSDGATFRSAANKAWLTLPPTAAAREFFGLPENYDSADGIENVNVNDNINDNAIYNLAGQKLSRPQKGINIINGKKILF